MNYWDRERVIAKGGGDYSKTTAPHKKYEEYDNETKCECGNDKDVSEKLCCECLAAEAEYLCEEER